MGSRITLYEAALAGAAATDGGAGRTRAIEAFEKADRLFRIIHLIRQFGAPTFGFVGALIVVVQLLGWAYNGFGTEYWQQAPVEAVLLRAVLLLGIALLSLSAWDILVFAERAHLVPAQLKAPELAPFRAQLDKCSDGSTPVYDQDGKRIDSPVFLSNWALILFSQHPAHRRFRLPNATKMFDEQPVVEAALLGEIAASHPKVQETPSTDSEPTIHAVINYSQTTNTVVVQNNVVVDAQRPTQESKPRKLHWFASVSGDTFLIRSKAIAGHWHGPQEAQVQLALDIAFAMTRSDQRPDILPKELRDAIVEKLIERQLPIGLSTTNSSEWISKILGMGKNDYAWIRRFLTEEGFTPPYELPFNA